MKLIASCCCMLGFSGAFAEGANADPSFQFSIGGMNGRTNNAQGVAVDAAQQYVYVATGAGYVQKFTYGGQFVQRIGKFGSSEGQFVAPYAVEVADNGDLFVLDTENYRIQRFDSDGNFERMWGWGVDDGSDAFQICTSDCQPGSAGGGAGQFDHAEDISLDQNGNLVVADTQNQRVQRFDQDGARLLTFGLGVATGALEPETCVTTCRTGLKGAVGEVADPRGIDVDSKGNIYVSVQTGDPAASKFTQDGVYIRGYTPPEGVSGVITGIGVDSERNALYVADRDGHRIHRFDSESGEFIHMWGWGVRDGAPQLQVCVTGCQIGQQGNGETQMNDTLQMDVDAGGRIWGANVSNSSIQVYNGDGSWVKRWRDVGEGPMSFNEPYGIDVDLAGNLYVSDSGNSRIQKYTRAGEHITGWTTGSPPLGVALGGNGMVYVIDGASVQRYSSGGTLLGSWGGLGTAEGKFGFAYGVAADRSGNVYVADSANARVQKFGPTGNVISVWGWGVRTGANTFQTCTSGCRAGIPGTGAGQFGNPLAIAVDPGGSSVYVTDGALGRVQRFSSSGVAEASWPVGIFPSGVAATSAGRLFIADSASDALRWFSPTGAQLGSYERSGSGPGEFSRPWDVAASCRYGELFVSDERDHSVEVFSDPAVSASCSGVDTAKPLLRVPRMKPKRFASAAGSVAFTFKLSEDATLRLAVQRKLTGNQWQPVSSKTIQGRSGDNSLDLAGQIGFGRLSAGNYRLVISTLDAADNPFQDKKINFKVTP